VPSGLAVTILVAVADFAVLVLAVGAGLDVIFFFSVGRVT
jgi:hypothetical protein